jgi:hypothetical protein
MSKLRFVGLDVHAETIAVTLSEAGGEVRSFPLRPRRSSAWELRSYFQDGFTRNNSRQAGAMDPATFRVIYLSLPTRSCSFAFSISNAANFRAPALLIRILST